MKNQVTENEVIQAIGGSQQGPISIDDIAKTVGTVRQVINPTLSALVKKGMVVSEKSTSGWPIFSLTEKASAEAAQSPAPAPTEPSRPAPTRLEVVRSVAQKVQQKEPVAVEQNTVETPPKATPTLIAVSSTPKQQLPATELNVLAYLSQQGRPMNDLRTAFGDCEELLADLGAKSLVDCDYIIDQHVYTLRSEAYKQYPVLSNREEVVALLAVKPEEIAAVIPDAVPPAAKTTASEAMAPSAQPSVAKDTPVIDQEKKPAAAKPIAHDEPERKVVREEFAQTEEFLMSGEIMKEISRLIDRGIREQLEKHRTESAQGIDLKSLAEKIQMASASLKQAASALDETLEIITKG